MCRRSFFEGPVCHGHGMEQSKKRKAVLKSEVKDECEDLSRVLAALQVTPLGLEGPWVTENIVILHMTVMREILMSLVAPAIQRAMQRKSRDLPVRCTIHLHLQLHLLLTNGNLSHCLMIEQALCECLGPSLVKRTFKAGSYALLGVPMKITRHGNNTVIELTYSVYTVNGDLIWPEY